MTVEELIELCEAPVEGLDGKPVVPEHIYLTVPKKTLPRDQMRLLGRRGPLGRVCNVREAPQGYSVVAIFQRKAVIAFLKNL